VGEKGRKVLPHISERVLLKSGGVERERQREGGNVLLHISGRVLLKSGVVEREREKESQRERRKCITSHIWEGFSEVRRRRERERDRLIDGNVLPHIAGRVLLKSGGVERERQRDGGKVLLHISGRVLLESGRVQREIERGTDRYYFTYLGGFY
jgi:hypothetical protein